MKPMKRVVLSESEKQAVLIEEPDAWDDLAKHPDREKRPYPLRVRSYEQTAAILGCPVATVRGLEQTALAKLREAIGPDILELWAEIQRHDRAPWARVAEAGSLFEGLR
jgi:hypothetical protein